MSVASYRPLLKGLILIVVTPRRLSCVRVGRAIVRVQRLACRSRLVGLAQL